MVPYKPGQTGNPGRRTKALAEVEGLARQASPHAMRRLIGLIDSDVALIAADKVLERGEPGDQKGDDRRRRVGWTGGLLDALKVTKELDSALIERASIQDLQKRTI